MNITILSGGSGSIQLQKGLKALYPHCKITNIINCLDDGKSTGVVREICNCLGPSDLRKNQYIQYLTNHSVHDKNILEFFESRVDILKDVDAFLFVLDKLKSWNLEIFYYATEEFFRLAPKDQIYEDFSIANIVYGGMTSIYKNLGFKNAEEKVAYFFKDFLNLKDDVIINSFENLILMARTTDGDLKDEGAIVDLNRNDVQITDVYFYNKDLNVEQEKYHFLNPRVEECILKNTDLLIFSSGTQWSSLIPTYKNYDFETIIEEYKGPSIFVVNTEEDKDMKGINSSTLIKTVSKYVDLETTEFLFNSDACESMRIPNEDHFYTVSAMGNNKGKHDPIKLAKTIFKLYYKINNNPDIVYFDFDDTLYTRKRDYKKIAVSKHNLSLLNELSKQKKVVITSGNKFSHIDERAIDVVNNNNKIDIWADGGLICYNAGKYCKHVLAIDTKDTIQIETFLHMLGYWSLVTFRGYRDVTTCINIKPLENDERINLCKHINRFLKTSNINCEAKVTGTTSIDITPIGATKKLILDQYSSYISLYIGDECHDGNDVEISEGCNLFINVQDVYETNLILKLLLEMK